MSCDFKKSTFLKKNTFKMQLFNRVKYKGLNYVEILLFNKRLGNYFIILRFDKKGNVSNYTNKFIIY